MNRTTKALNFIRKNAVYFVIALCILAVGFTVTFMLLNNSSTVDPSLQDPNDQVQDTENPNGPDDGEDDNNNGDSTDTNNPTDPTEPTDPVVKVVTFIMPVESPTSIFEYTDTVVYSSTLNRYAAHRAIDFFASEGTSVLAVYDGTVEKVDNSLLHGYTVVIDHGNGLKTTYNSLLDGDNVTVGQTVKQGDVIGEVSVTNRQEYKDGAHLHFSVEENGEVINPSKYLVIDEK